MGQAMLHRACDYCGNTSVGGKFWLLQRQIITVLYYIPLRLIKARRGSVSGSNLPAMWFTFSTVPDSSSFVLLAAPPCVPRRLQYSERGAEAIAKEYRTCVVVERKEGHAWGTAQSRRICQIADGQGSFKVVFRKKNEGCLDKGSTS